MPDNFATQFAKILLRHDIDLMRVDAGTRAKIFGVLKGLEKETIATISKFGTISGSAAYGIDKQLGLMTRSIAPTAERAYKQMTDITNDTMVSISAAQNELITEQLNRAFTVDMGLKKLSLNVLKTLPGNTMIEGAPMQQWFDKQSKDFQQRFMNQMRQGIINGESIQDMTRRVRGTQAAGFKDGIMAASRREAQTLVRSSVMASANKAREATFQQNSDVIKGMQWLSTLDQRTSDTCISLDGEAWDMNGNPIGATKTAYLGPPPAHFNCRSTLIPLTKSFSELTKNPAIKKKLDTISTQKKNGLRASMNGAVSNKLNYEEWLRGQPPNFQLEVLGPTKFRMWQAGQLPFRDLIDQSHNPISIDALIAQHGVPRLSLDAALEKSSVTQKVAGTTFTSPSQWYKTFARPDMTVDDILAAQDAKTIEMLDKTARRVSKYKTTEEMFKNPDGTWFKTRERDVHDVIIRKILSKEAITRARAAPGEKPRYVMFGGRGGSGKGSLTKARADGGLEVIDKKKFIVLDADEIKQMIKASNSAQGYEGWNAFLFHEESSHIFDRITALAQRLNLNIVHDMTLKTGKTALARAAQFTKAGYDIEGYYVFLPQQEAAKRAISRFKTFKGDYSGRYVPPQVVLSNTTNESTFEELSKLFKKWEFYDNQGARPRLVGKGGISQDILAARRARDIEEYKASVISGKKPSRQVTSTFNTLAPAERKIIRKEIDDAIGIDVDAVSKSNVARKKAEEEARRKAEEAAAAEAQRARAEARRLAAEKKAAEEEARRRAIEDELNRIAKQTIDDALKNNSPFLADALRDILDVIPGKPHYANVLKEAYEVAAKAEKAFHIETYISSYAKDGLVPTKTRQFITALPSNERFDISHKAQEARKAYLAEREAQAKAKAALEKQRAAAAQSKGKIGMPVFSTSEKFTGEDVMKALNSAPEEQRRKLMEFNVSKPQKILGITSRQMTRGKTARLLAKSIFDFLNLDEASHWSSLGTFTTTGAKNTNGFTSVSFEHVVVKIKPTTSFKKFKAAEMTKGVEDTIFARQNANNMPWTITDTVRVQGGSEAAQNISTIVHELGHQVHFWAGSPTPPSYLADIAITKYSTTNAFEFHAEHFAMWYWNRKALAEYSEQLAEYFDDLVEKAIKARQKVYRNKVYKTIDD